MLPRARLAAGAATVAALPALLVALATPAAAAASDLVIAVNRDAGDDPGPPISIGTTLLLYVVAPTVLFLVIALAVYVPTVVRGPRYRPGLGWWAAPQWIGGPEAAEEALARGARTTDGGGASARW